jgi:glycerate dehydrogenase
MKIVVLDGYTLNPGDLSWEGFEALGECAVHDRTAPDQVIERAGDCEIVLTNKTVLSADLINQLRDMRYIGVLATGYNVVDVAAARERDIAVCNVPTYTTRSVAQMVFAHVLNFAQHVQAHSDGVRRGKWTECPDFCYWDVPLVELEGKIMGIVGMGRIGRAVAELALSFGMRVLTTTRDAAKSLPEGVERVGLDDLFRESDVLSLHCPLTKETEHLVNAGRLSMMKPSAILINTSRGPLLDEQAVADALNVGAIAGAGLDVLSSEPARPDNPLLKATNCVITPHLAWATKESRSRLMATAIENVSAFLRGERQNRVD